MISRQIARQIGGGRRRPLCEEVVVGRGGGAALVPLLVALDLKRCGVDRYPALRVVRRGTRRLRVAFRRGRLGCVLGAWKRREPHCRST